MVLTVCMITVRLTSASEDSRAQQDTTGKGCAKRGAQSGQEACLAGLQRVSRPQTPDGGCPISQVVYLLTTCAITCTQKKESDTITGRCSLQMVSLQQDRGIA